MSQRPVVREQQGACRIHVEAPDRDDACLVRHERDDRRPTLRIARRRDHARRLVEQHIGEALLGNSAPVDLDDIAGQDERVQLAQSAVDPDTAGLDQLVRRSSGRNTGASEIRVQPHATIVAAATLPRRA